MQVVIVDTPDEVGRLAAAKISHLVRNHPDAVLGLATGSSPLAIYAELTRQVEEKGLDCSQVRAFALDEYVGLPDGHPESYRAVLERDVVGPLRMDPANRARPGRCARPTSPRPAPTTRRGSPRPAASTCRSSASARTGTSASTSRVVVRLADPDQDARADRPGRTTPLLRLPRPGPDALPDSGARHHPGRAARWCSSPRARPRPTPSRGMVEGPVGAVPGLGAAAARRRERDRRRGCGEPAHHGRLLPLHLANRPEWQRFETFGS